LRLKQPWYPSIFQGRCLDDAANWGMREKVTRAEPSAKQVAEIAVWRFESGQRFVEWGEEDPLVTKTSFAGAAHAFGRDGIPRLSPRTTEDIQSMMKMEIEDSTGVWVLGGVKDVVEPNSLADVKYKGKAPSKSFGQAGDWYYLQPRIYLFHETTLRDSPVETFRFEVAVPRKRDPGCHEVVIHVSVEEQRRVLREICQSVAMIELHKRAGVWPANRHAWTCGSSGNSGCVFWDRCTREI